MNLTDAERIARKLIHEHAPDWRFDWMPRARVRLGECDFGPVSASGRYLTRTIRLSRPLTLLNDQDTIEQTILHELAHVRAGHKAPAHGRIWKAHALALGVRNPNRCTEAKGIEGNVFCTCPECGVGFRQHKVTYALFHKQACAPCYKRGKVVRFNVTREDGTPIPCPPSPKPRRRRR